MHHRYLSPLLLIILAIGLLGCASAGDRSESSRSDYKRLLELQKSKARFAAEEDAKLESKIGLDMTASDYERLGDNYARQGNAVMALVQYQKALETAPDEPRLHVKLGLLFLGQRLYAEAKKEFSLVLAKEPKNGIAHEGMGRLFFAEGDLAKAEQSFQEALQLDPKLWQSHMFLGMIYDRRKEFDRAIAQYSAALVLRPASSILLNNLALSYYSQGEYRKAEEAINTALQLEPSAKAWNNLGLILGKQGKYDDALEAFRNAGDEAGAYNNLGMIYMSQGKYAEALQAFQKAFAIKPQYYSKAQENIKKAEAALKTQAAQQPDQSKE